MVEIGLCKLHNTYVFWFLFSRPFLLILCYGAKCKRRMLIDDPFIYFTTGDYISIRLGPLLWAKRPKSPLIPEKHYLARFGNNWVLAHEFSVARSVSWVPAPGEWRRSRTCNKGASQAANSSRNRGIPSRANSSTTWDGDRDATHWAHIMSIMRIQGWTLHFPCVSLMWLQLLKPIYSS